MSTRGAKGSPDLYCAVRAIFIIYHIGHFRFTSRLHLPVSGYWATSDIWQMGHFRLTSIMSPQQDGLKCCIITWPLKESNWLLSHWQKISLPFCVFPLVLNALTGLHLHRLDAHWAFWWKVCTTNHLLSLIGIELETISLATLSKATDEAPARTLYIYWYSQQRSPPCTMWNQMEPTRFLVELLWTVISTYTNIPGLCLHTALQRVYQILNNENNLESQYVAVNVDQCRSIIAACHE